MTSYSESNAQLPARPKTLRWLPHVGAGRNTRGGSAAGGGGRGSSVVSELLLTPPRSPPLPAALSVPPLLPLLPAEIAAVAITVPLLPPK